MASRRRSYPPYPRGTSKISRVMDEFRRGQLYSSSGYLVTDPRQAVAIALSEQRRKEGISQRDAARGMAWAIEMRQGRQAWRFPEHGGLSRRGAEVAAAEARAGGLRAWVIPVITHEKSGPPSTKRSTYAPPSRDAASSRWRGRPAYRAAEILRAAGFPQPTRLAEELLAEGMTPEEIAFRLEAGERPRSSRPPARDKRRGKKKAKAGSRASLRAQRSGKLRDDAEEKIFGLASAYTRCHLRVMSSCPSR